MKSEFKTKLIQHMLNKKNGEKGFTLIELLVVIIIIGILAAIALPSFLNQANKARQSEAKSYVGSMNRAQQAFFLEKSKFSTDITQLGLGINTSTENYTYSISLDAAATQGQPAAPAVPPAAFINNFSYSNKPSLKAYAGTTWVGSTGAENSTLAVLCESVLPIPGTGGGASAPVGITVGLPLPATGLCVAGMESIK